MQLLTTSNKDVRFDHLRSNPAAERFIPAILPWVLQAWSPYIEWLLGGRVAARRTIESWMRRASSEVSVWRSTALLHREEPVGAFIALGARELRVCRAADALAALGTSDPEGREALTARMAEAKGLFQPVEADCFYLSKMGVAPTWRRRGLGRELLGGFLEQGRASGFKRFRLDVYEGQVEAIGLYRSEGFELLSRGATRDGRLRYQAMILER